MKNPTPREQLMMYKTYEERKNNWYDTEIARGKETYQNKENWQNNFNEFLDKMRKEEVII